MLLISLIHTFCVSGKNAVLRETNWIFIIRWRYEICERVSMSVSAMTLSSLWISPEINFSFDTIRIFQWQNRIKSRIQRKKCVLSLLLQLSYYLSNTLSTVWLAVKFSLSLYRSPFIPWNSSCSCCSLLFLACFPFIPVSLFCQNIISDRQQFFVSSISPTITFADFMHCMHENQAIGGNTYFSSLSQFQAE